MLERINVKVKPQRVCALSLLDDDAYARIERAAAGLAAGLRAAFAAAGVPARVPRVGTLVGLHLGDADAFDYDSARTTDTGMYKRFFHAMLRRGVAMAPGAYEVMFTGLAHDDAVIDAIASRAHEAAAEAARG